MQTLSAEQTGNVDYTGRVKAIFAASSGNLVEWYDFYVYAFFAFYFSKSFFPAGSQTVQLLKSSLIFFIGFLMRPIGGWVFGYIADRYGRKSSMIISVYLMCFGSLFIAFLPGYQTIGAVAPILLTVARMIQGLSVGGEYGSTATYMSEVATKGRRGFLASFQYVTLTGGQLLASLSVMIILLVLPEQQVYEWGWRIPFGIGAVLGVVALYLRKTLHETSSQKTRERSDAGSFKALWECRRAFLTVLAFTAGGSLAFYTYTVYMPKFIVTTVGLDKQTGSYVSTAALFVLMLLQPLFGWLSDIFSRKAFMMIFGALLAVGTVPLIMTLKFTGNPYAAFGLLILAFCMLSFYTSINGLLKAEMFPPQVRALGVGLSYAISNAIFGGSAESVALAFKAGGYENSFFYYVSVMGILVFITSLTLHKGEGTLEHEH